MHRFSAVVALVCLATATARAGDGFVPLFNGKDLTGWHNVNCAPGTFFVKDGLIITTGKPTGYLRTDKQYENFILEFEWFHAPNPKGSVGNSGLFVWGDPIPAMGTGYTRSIEVQVLVNLTFKNNKGEITATSQGDLFSIWGAKCKPDRPHPSGSERCLPSENNCKGEFEWNHYRVVANNGVLKLTVNGKEVSGVSECNPRKGYLALESEGSECRFKNLKIKELPSTNPQPSEICDVAKGFQCLFTGLDLTGWKAGAEEKKHWTMKDGVLTYDGKSKAADRLLTEKSFGDIEMVVDFKSSFVLHVSGVATLVQATGKWNRAVARVKGDRLNITVNGKSVADNVQLKGTPAPGPIALAANKDGVPMQFRNVFVRELRD
jgi:hypothetical protein